MSERPQDEMSTVELIERLQQQTTTLVKTEVGNALDEVKSKGTRLGIGTGISGAGVLVLLYGLGACVAAAVIGLAEAVPAWLAALLIGLALVLIGAATAAVGAKRARSAVPPIPERTAASVQTDVATVKEHL